MSWTCRNLTVLKWAAEPPDLKPAHFGLVDQKIYIMDVQPTNMTVWCYHVNTDPNLRNIFSNLLKLCSEEWRQF